MASKMMPSMAVLMVMVMMMAAAALFSCSVTSARTLSSMEKENTMKKPTAKPDMEKTFFHPFLPPYVLGHGGPFFGGGIGRGGGLGTGLGGGFGSSPTAAGGLGGGFGGGLGIGNGDGTDEFGSRVIGGRTRNIGDENRKEGAGSGGDLGRAGADQGLP